MPAYTTADIRNIALAGHAMSGKTTLVEAILHRLKLIPRAGTVEDGQTVCDFEPEEKYHKHSLNSALVNFDCEGRHINLIDTPGYPDFVGQFLSVIPSVETVAIVIGADRGIQTNTRRVFKAAEERHLPRFIIVNKIDDHVDALPSLLQSIQATFGAECLPVNLPTPDGKDVIDIWESKAGKSAFGSVAEAHQKIVEQVVEVDNTLMNTYLEQGENLEPKQLHDAFEKALREGHLVPVMFCSARTGAGLEDLLHIITNLCPSPFEGTPAPFLVGQGGTEAEWHPALYPKADPVAHVFKVTTDQFVGKLAMVRIHQGTLTPGQSLFIGDNKKPFRVAHIHKVFGKDHKEVDSAIPGDIIAIAKIEELHFGGVLHGSHDLDTLHFLDVPMPKPMYGLAVSAKSRNDDAKIGDVLRKIADEDPTFIIERNATTHETVCRAMGELHMRMILEKLHNRFKLDLETKPPKIPYKETITAKAEGHHRHKKQTGGAGQFGEVFLRVEPIAGFSAAGTSVGESHEEFEFVDDTVGGSIPRQFMPAVEKGIRMVLEQGAVAGYPLTGVRVLVYDGKHHAVDSKEVAFVAAGKRAFIDAVSKARPALLEPYVDVEVSCPAGNIGDIAADFSSKRGQVISTDMLPGDFALIHAKVPLAEMSTYTGQLKSITAGQGSFVMNYSHDEKTPPGVQAEVVAAFKPKHDED